MTSPRRINRRRFISGSLAAIAAASHTTTPSASPNEKIRLLVVTGGHEFDPSFFSLFDGYPDLDWDKAEHVSDACDAFKKNFAEPYDAVLLYDFKFKAQDEEKENFLDAFGGGRGLIVLHHALGSHPDWKRFHEVAGGRYLFEPEENRRASEYEHDVKLKIDVADPDHPVTRGVDPFEIVDEAYRYFLVDRGVKELLTTTTEKSSPVLGWAHRDGQSRVATIQPGHGPGIFKHPNYRRLIIQAIRWTAAHGSVNASSPRSNLQ